VESNNETVSPYAAAIAAIRINAKKSALRTTVDRPDQSDKPRTTKNQADKPDRSPYPVASKQRKPPKGATRQFTRPTASKESSQPTRPSGSAYSKAVALLGSRELSEKQLQTKLIKLAFPAEDIEATIIRLRADGYLSNQRFSDSCLQSLARRGKGPRFIQGKLVQAGIAAQSAREGLQNAEIDWLANAKSLLARKFRDDPPGPVPHGFAEKRQARELANKALAKRARFLASRGFPEDVIRSALKRDVDC
jgi:regulatory protein